MLTCGSILAVNLSPPALTFSRLGSCLPSVPAVLGSRDCTCPLAAASVADEAMTIDGQPTTSEDEKERAHDEARAVAMTFSKVVNDDVAVLPTANASAERADESEIEVDAAEKCTTLDLPSLAGDRSCTDEPRNQGSRRSVREVSIRMQRRRSLLFVE